MTFPSAALPRAALAGAVAVVLAACDDPDTSEVELQPSTAAVLADGADRLAAALDDGEPCRVVAEADALVERAEVAVADGTAPADVGTEVVRVAQTLTTDVRCDPDGPVDLDSAPGTDDGTEPEPAEPDPAPQDDPPDAPADDDVPSDDPGDGPPDDPGGGPPDERGGGPPDHADPGGRGGGQGSGQGAAGRGGGRGGGR